MQSLTRRFFSLAAAALLAACVRDIDEQTDTTAAAGTTAAPVAPTPPAESAVRVEVDIAARQLRVVRGDTAVETYPVAVGTSEWPTQPGSWTITQVVWNPEWVPPKESWAKDEEPKDPGAADNPLGAVQLVYDPPRTIHGTNEPASIGKAASHGSIRMRNADAIALARRVMQAGGAAKDDAWIAEARRNRTTKQIIDLPQPVAITVK